MLTHLTLINFALAEHLTLDISQGFNVLTGETGAGKSLLLDALSACLGERVDSSYVRYNTEKADVTAVFSFEPHSPEAQWLAQHELDDGSGEIHLRRVIFATGRSKAWINGRPSSLTELKALGRLLVQLYSQHSQQQLLDSPYPRQWLDRYHQFDEIVEEVHHTYHLWQQAIHQHQEAIYTQASRLQRIETLQFQLEELEEIMHISYDTIEQEFDQLSHYETIMQDCQQSIYLLDEMDQSISTELSSIIRRLEPHSERHKSLSNIYQNMLHAQNALDEGISELRQYIDRQTFDPERMEELNQHLSSFHRLARKYRTQPETLQQLYQTWQQELEHLEQQQSPEDLAEYVQHTEQNFLKKAEHLDQLRQTVAQPLAEQLTTLVKTLALPEAQFKFEFTPVDQPTADGLSHIQLLFTANKGIPPQPLAKVASGGELSRIALVMQVMNAEKKATDVLVFDEIDVGISGGTAEIVGRLLANLAQHVQILCITHQAQVAAQADQHLLIKKLQTDPASSTILQLTEDEIILELARMTGGIEIEDTTLQHAKQLRQLKFSITP